MPDQQTPKRKEPFDPIAGYQESLKATTEKLDEIIIAIHGEYAAWQYHQGVVLPPEKYDRSEHWFRELWLAREEANSAIRFLEEKMDEDESSTLEE